MFDDWSWLPLITPICYIVAVYVLRVVIRTPVDFKSAGVARALLVLHNGWLSLWSLIMFLMLLYAAFFQESLHSIFCVADRHQFSGVALAALQMYHVSKYVELLDTLFLLLKMRPVTFLQVFHHSIMIPISYSWLRQTWKLGILGGGLNSAVHVIMYYYFARSSYEGFRPWWRLYITQFQLVQFVLSKLLIWIQILAFTPQPHCNNLSQYTQWATQSMNLIFLGLFIAFYIREKTKEEKN